MFKKFLILHKKIVEGELLRYLLPYYLQQLGNSTNAEIMFLCSCSCLSPLHQCQRSPPLRIQWHRWLRLRPSHQRRHVPQWDLPEARQDSQPPMDRMAAVPAASDEVVKKYTRKLPQNS